MKQIVPFPLDLDGTDDILTITDSESQVHDKGRLSGYPGTQMSELGVDEYGTAYWLDPLGNRTDIADLFVRMDVDYSVPTSGLYDGVGTISDFYLNVIERNDFIATDKSLVHILPAVPTAQKVNSNIDIEFDYGIRVTASGQYSSSYSMLRALDRTSSGVGDGFLWNTGAGEKWFQIEYPEPIMIVGFDYFSFRGDYTVRNGEVQVSTDGTNWTTVHRINSSTTTERNQRIAPVTAKYIRLLELNGGNTGIGGFNVLTSKRNATLGFNTNSDWYDKSTLKLTETDTEFELSEIYSQGPNSDNITIATMESRAVVSASLLPGQVIDHSANQFKAISLTKIEHNGLGISANDFVITLEPGQYIIDFTHYFKGTLYSTAASCAIGIMEMKSGKFLTEAQEFVRTRVQTSDSGVSGRFEFYLPEAAKIAFVERRNVASSVTDSVDGILPGKYFEAEIIKLTDTPIGDTMLSPKYITRKNLIADYAIEDIVTNSSPVFNADWQAPGMLTESTLSGDAILMSVTPDLGPNNPLWIEIELPEAVTPTLATLTNRNYHSARPPSEFAIFGEVDGEWVQISDISTTKAIMGYTVDVPLRVSQPISKYRIEIYKFEEVQVGIATFRLHDDTRIVNDRISATFTHDSSNELNMDDLCGPGLVANTNRIKNVGFQYRADDVHNLRAVFNQVADYNGDRTMYVNRISGFKTTLEAEIVITSKPTLQPMLLASDLPPGLYEITFNNHTYVPFIYLEKA